MVSLTIVDTNRLHMMLVPRNPHAKHGVQAAAVSAIHQQGTWSLVTGTYGVFVQALATALPGENSATKITLLSMALKTKEWVAQLYP